jgi:hypothetical protein
MALMFYRSRADADIGQTNSRKRTERSGTRGEDPTYLPPAMID